ncbi:MAG: hypothetical protein H0T93_05675 [Chloroflexia bacterium]|nr:hypothetical protein [Chloroflexia bacterium]
MSVSLANVGHHLLASRTLLHRRQVQVAIGIAAIATLLSVILAPDVTPSMWDWIRIILVGILGASSVLMFTAAQLLPAESTDRRPRLVIAGALVAMALLLNLTFTLGTALIFSIGFTVIVLIATGDSALRTTKTIASALIATIPFWVWTALQAWTAGLLLLIPLASVAVISNGHMRAAMNMPSDNGSPLTPRGHRLACWLGILGSALIALVAGLLSDASNGVVALGAAGAIVIVGLEAGSPPGPVSGSRSLSPAIVDVALLWIALCWIVSL